MERSSKCFLNMGNWLKITLKIFVVTVAYLLITGKIIVRYILFVHRKKSISAYLPNEEEWEDTSRHNEQRWGLIGYSESNRMLYVVSTEQDDDAWRIISARKATKQEKLRYEKTNAFN